MKTTVLALASLALASTALTVCARTPTPAAASDLVASSVAASSSTASTGAVAKAASPAPKLARVVVHKSPYCGCCGLWVEHMREAGFAVEVRNVNNLNPIKQSVGVPLAKGSCHTAQVGKYFIEGHVPAEDVKRLLAEQPDAKGLVLPGMPKGSPGMEVPDGSVDAYTVELVANDGSTSAYAQHGQ
ncbi:DUF411 domain-containing protein [Novilysobacter erysipheiresistens]|uniref:DUF411 domain-containing protein n=1 Tax=Novilysobacter erysipheiresistens TaxID=1749332 RepID=A0ABU7Z200_9GAMM